ncbi:hypothetical protein WOLCODRAFT_157017 [Wolfiporia cocos MD-104 SS10]|uniref:Uncharacterized protein n=1 Tax=Wolfiporia cocos (strain MD-104) TaxID=742152 RepID=A0A2H3JHZ5_WOLCO|nr:hypothetical protein WOLCODRAFT_157017 [Wolfiporia cocos MD-104 SS10]
MARAAAAVLGHVHDRRYLARSARRRWSVRKEQYLGGKKERTHLSHLDSTYWNAVTADNWRMHDSDNAKRFAKPPFERENARTKSS